MKYFQDIATLAQAKKQYRKLALQLHPDVGGSPDEFKQLQKEYQILLTQLKEKDNTTIQSGNDIIDELGILAKTLIKTQLPQKYMKQKMNNSKTVLEKNLYSVILKLLDEFS